MISNTFIDTFKGKYSFLSNFYPSVFSDKNLMVWPTVEHAYQAYKCEKTDSIFEGGYLESRKQFQKLKTPQQAKKLGKTIKLRSDWDNVKLRIMEELVYNKFEQGYLLRDLLLKTNNITLIEGNFWHDNIWGNCYCEKCKVIIGQNYLGFILMRVRGKLI
jgi:ribA/ribD-fused uncharacterized protein